MKKKIFAGVAVLAMSMTIGISAMAKEDVQSSVQLGEVVVTCSANCTGIGQCWTWDVESLKCVRSPFHQNYCRC